MKLKPKSSPSPDSSAEFITPADWAGRLQVSKRQIFRLIDARIIPPYDFAIGKTRRWHRSTFDAWVIEQTGRN